MVLFADTSGSQLAVTIVMLIAVSFVVRWAIIASGRRSQQPRRPDRDELREHESAVIGQLNRLEVRLHEFSREVDGRIQTRMAILDRLIIDAEREIQRLRSLLGHPDPDGGPSGGRVPDILAFSPSAPRPLISDSSNGPAAPTNCSDHAAAVRVCTLFDAGLREADVAVQTGLPVAEVRSILAARAALRRGVA